jgi:hypothetical protein
MTRSSLRSGGGRELDDWTRARELVVLVEHGEAGQQEVGTAASGGGGALLRQQPPGTTRARAVPMSSRPSMTPRRDMVKAQEQKAVRSGHEHGRGLDE